ncbi:MAG: hypothetical protein EOO89_21065 [Pedobacter sp.]|nr:MAG: hypothetical protein EOO89_21065 [Pedobacter sp.]
MNKGLFVLVLIVVCSKTFAQNVALVSNVPIPAKEFLWVYKKNNTAGTQSSFEDMSSYLNLYINFKLKVLDAKALKMDRDTGYLNEVKNYESIIKAKIRVRGKDELKYIINEYREGVLMFNISEKKVWTVNRSVTSGAMTEEEQKQLEKEWIEELKKKYPVKIYEDELKKLVRI